MENLIDILPCNRAELIQLIKDAKLPGRSRLVRLAQYLAAGSFAASVLVGCVGEGIAPGVAAATEYKSVAVQQVASLTWTLPPSPTRTPTPTSTEVPKFTNTPTRTPEEPRVTRVVDEAAERENIIKIEKRVADFLGSRGEFTEEYVKKNRLTDLGGQCRDPKTWKNGIVSADMKGAVFVSGFNLGVVRVGKSNVFILGTQNLDGKRVVRPVLYLTEELNNDDLITGAFIFPTNEFRNNGLTSQIIDNDAEFLDLAKKNTGKAMAVRIIFVPVKETLFGDLSSTLDSTLRDKYEKLNSRTDKHLEASLDFACNVWRPTGKAVEGGSLFLTLEKLSLICPVPNDGDADNTIVASGQISAVKNRLDKLPATLDLMLVIPKN